MLDTSLLVTNEVLTAYWTRTLNLFVGSRLRITLTDGRVRTGLLVSPGQLLAADGTHIRIPFGSVQQAKRL